MSSELVPQEPEHLIRSEYVLRGRYITVRVDTLELPNGQVIQREVVEHPGAVAIVPLLDTETVLLIRQYRRAARRYLLEIPAGTLEPGEEPLNCAQRELREETGYKSDALTHLFSQFLAPGYSQEVLHVFMAQHLTPAPLRGDTDECIETVPMPLADTPQMIRDGRIQDAKTIAALLTVIYLREHT